MSISRIIASKVELRSEIVDLMVTQFSLQKLFAETLYDNVVHSNIDQVIDDSYYFIEAPYIDKVYRDSYYSYFSSKLGNYKKDSIRLSIFKEEIKEEDFRNPDSLTDLQNRYLGFITLRPTTPQIIGRSIISPKALKVNNFLSIAGKFATTANSIKFEVVGFPHSSQDTETISCAETTLWAMMEYFGNKYPEYKPVLPSRIVEVLRIVSAERQIPSKGLNIQQMAYALKEFGFGTRIYSLLEFGAIELKRLFATYIESGVPIIVAVDNRDKGGDVGHALLCIGHDRTAAAQINALPLSAEPNPFIANEIATKNISFFDNSDLDRNFVFVDDNLPAYPLNKFATPTSHYPDASWHNCDITYFIVPLYPKIYLEAYEARNFIKQVLFSLFTIANNSEIFLRFYLASSRSYKHNIALNPTLQDDFKALILETEMPKFIWVAEISNKALIQQPVPEATGLIIVDATEANVSNVKPLILAIYNDELISFDYSIGDFSRKLLPLQKFSIFTDNLKGF